MTRKAADQGHPHASYNLAIGHLKGYKSGLKPGWGILVISISQAYFIRYLQQNRNIYDLVGNTTVFLFCFEHILLISSKGLGTSCNNLLVPFILYIHILEFYFIAEKPTCWYNTRLPRAWRKPIRCWMRCAPEEAAKTSACAHACLTRKTPYRKFRAPWNNLYVCFTAGQGSTTKC